jgi:hypothetical protein
MAIELHYGAAIPSITASPVIKYLAAKWNTLKAAGRLDVQLLTEGSYDIPAKSIYMVTMGEADFLYMHVGERVREAIGQDFTGRLISSVGDRVSADLREAYAATVEYGQPMCVRFTSPLTENVLLWERMILPVPAGDAGTILVCYSEVMGHQLEVYQYVFRNSPVPMMVVYPIFTPQKAMDDGWIVLVNDVARDVFDVRDKFGSSRLRELKAFQRAEFWAELSERYPLANPEVALHTPVIGDDHVSSLIRLNHLVLLRFRPKSLFAPTMV